MDQKKAIELLKAIRFSWHEPTQEFLIDEHPFEDLSLAFDKDYIEISVATDGLGSPGHDEQTILSLLEIADPVIPLNVLRRLGGRKLIGLGERNNGKPLEIKDFGKGISLPKDVSEMLLFPKDGKPTNISLPGDIDGKEEE